MRSWRAEPGLHVASAQGGGWSGGHPARLLQGGQSFLAQETAQIREEKDPR